MNISQNDPLYFRIRGIEFINRGKELFYSPQTPKDRFKGYEVFKKGIELMIEYGKSKSAFLLN